MMVKDQTHKCHIDQLRNKKGKTMPKDFYFFPSPSPKVGSSTE